MRLILFIIDGLLIWLIYSTLAGFYQKGREEGKKNGRQKKTNRK